jgi:hypothetical protein
MAMTFDQVEKIANALPGVTVGTSWGNRTWKVNDKGFAWHRPLNKADLKRLGDATPPVGDILALRVESLDAKDALLAMGLPGFFTIEHFNGYAAVLIELRKARAKDVRNAILDAHATMMSRSKKAPRKSRRVTTRDS